MGLTSNYLYFLLVFVGLLSLGFRAGYNNALMPAINQWFRRHRALAMAVAGMGSPFGGILIAPMMGLLVYEIGWRNAAFFSGAAILAVVLPLSFFVYRTPEEKGLLPDGAKPTSEPPGLASAPRPAHPHAYAPAPGEPDFTAREAMKTPAFWLLVWAVGLRNTVHSGMQFLLSPVIVWFLMGSGRAEDDSVRLSALLVGLLSLSSLVMNPIVGWLGDNMSKQRLSAVAMVGGALSLLVLLSHSGSLWQACLFVVLLAASETANPLAWAIMGDFFGRRSYATLRGVAAPAGPDDVHEHAGLDGPDIRQHRQLLLGIAAAGSHLLAGGGQLLDSTQAQAAAAGSCSPGRLTAAHGIGGESEGRTAVRPYSVCG